MDHIYDTRGEMDKSEYDIGYGNRGTLRDAFKDGSVEDISKKFMLLFERPKDQSKEKIEFRQEQALNAFGRIPEPDKVSTPKAIASAPPQVEEESTLDKLASFFGMGDKSLKVGRGDTLSQIAEREGVSVRDIAEASGIQDINKIQAGQELTIPSQGLLSILGFAQGGDIGQYFEGQVVGNGDGMSDQILFEVEGNNPDKALLSRDEYVIPADVVAMLGNGSSNAGSEQLDKFIKGIRQDSFGTQKQQRELNAQQGLRGLV
jgi:LysM repeat protein